MAFAVTIFTQDNCPKCIEAKRKLKEAEIEYKEIDVGSIDGRVEFLMHVSRQSTTPAFLLDGVEVDSVEEIIKSYNKTFKSSRVNP